MRTLAMVGVPERCAVWLAAAEIAGAIGLIAGLFWWPVGIAASVGIIGYFVGATGSHLRVRDWHVTAPLILLLTGVGALVLRMVSH
jgi:DoxX-like family